MRLIPVALVCLLLSTGCDPSRRTTGKHDGQTVNLNFDTLTIKPGPAEVYSPTPTRVNDILHTSLDVRFDWDKRYLYGKATIAVRPYFYPVKTIALDARGMELKEVALITRIKVSAGGEGLAPGPDGTVPEVYTEQVTRKALDYDYAKDVLTVKLDREYTRNETYMLYIDYIAKPDELKTGGSDAITSDKGLYFINPDGKDSLKPKQIWTQGETQSNSVWFPTIDRTNEKFTHDIRMTVAEKYVTLSNGMLVSSTANSDGTRTDYWRMDLPHAAYLVMMAVGEFAVVKDTWRGRPVNYYVEKAYEPYARTIFGKTPAMMEFFSNKLGVEYPWPKYSQICVRDYVSGAMENTTATIHGENLQQTPREMLDGDYEDYISHELFHQWFGDLVTCESWSNLPLNESFANYGEDLWEKEAHGSDAEEYHSYVARLKYFREAASEKQVPLIRYYLANREDMFDAHSYEKGGQVLRMLHAYVGDEAFFASLKLYLETNRYKNAEIDNLRLAFEQVTGEDLHWYFDQWFFAPGHPVVEIENTYDAAKKEAVLKLKQIQGGVKGIPDVFRLPMDVAVYVNGKRELHRIVMDKRQQEFRFAVTAAPDLVLADPARRVLMERKEVKTPEAWAYQFKNATSLIDRLEGLQQLAPYKAPKSALAKEMLGKALTDKFWYIRLQGILRLEGEVVDYKSQVAGMMLNDEKAAVRNAAVYSLAERVNDPSMNDYFKKALNDSSYEVMGSAIEAIAKLDPEAGIKLAATYEKESNPTVIIALCHLYASAGSAANYDYMINASSRIGGFDSFAYLRSYGRFLTRCPDETVIKGLEHYNKLVEKRRSDYFRSAVGNSIEIVRKHYADKAADLQKRIADLKATKADATGLASLEEKYRQAKAMEMRAADKKQELLKK